MTSRPCLATTMTSYPQLEGPSFMQNYKSDGLVSYLFSCYLGKGLETIIKLLEYSTV